MNTESVFPVLYIKPFVGCWSEGEKKYVFRFSKKAVPPDPKSTPRMKLDVAKLVLCRIKPQERPRATQTALTYVAQNDPDLWVRLRARCALDCVRGIGSRLYIAKHLTLQELDIKRHLALRMLIPPATIGEKKAILLCLRKACMHASLIDCCLRECGVPKELRLNILNYLI